MLFRSRPLHPQTRRVGWCGEHPQRLRLWQSALVAFAITLAALATMLPAQSMPRLYWPSGEPVSDKLSHIVVFWALGCLCGLVFGRVLISFACLLALGLGLEGAQLLVDFGREGDLRDALANCLGLTLALASLVTWRMLRSLLNKA